MGIKMDGIEIPPCALLPAISADSYKRPGREGEFKVCTVFEGLNKKFFEELRSFGVAEECLKHSECPTVNAMKSLAKELNIVWESPLHDLSGYAAMCRNAVLGLDDMGVSVCVKPIC